MAEYGRFQYELIEHCDCHRTSLKAEPFPIEHFTSLADAVQRYIQHRRSGALYWAVHVNHKHLCMNLNPDS